MSVVKSTMLETGTTGPDFSLPDPDGRIHHLSDIIGDNGLVIMFISNHCPFVVHIAEEISRIAEKYLDKGVGFVAIACSDLTTHPQDGPDKMREFSKKYRFPFPYLFDASQKTAKAYKAACTPDFFVLDEKRRVFYTGRLDDSTPRNDKQITGNDLRNALDALINGETPPLNQMPSMGCSIKWKKGNEPEYFGTSK